VLLLFATKDVVVAVAVDDNADPVMLPVVLYRILHTVDVSLLFSNIALVLSAYNITENRKIQKQHKRIKRVIRFDTMEIDRRESRNRNNNDHSTELLLILILILIPRDREYSSYSFRTCWKFFFDDNSNTTLVFSYLI